MGKSMDTQHILVTGAADFFGTNLRQELEEEGMSVDL